MSETAIDFFHFVESFSEHEKQKTNVSVWVLEHPIQKFEISTCGVFRIYFYENLLFRDENSKLHSHKKLTKKAVETLLNELFSLNREKTEKQ